MTYLLTMGWFPANTSLAMTPASFCCMKPSREMGGRMDMASVKDILKQCQWAVADLKLDSTLPSKLRTSTETSDHHKEITCCNKLAFPPGTASLLDTVPICHSKQANWTKAALHVKMHPATTSRPLCPWFIKHTGQNELCFLETCFLYKLLEVCC